MGRVMVEMANYQKIVQKNRIADRGSMVFVRASSIPSANRFFFELFYLGGGGEGGAFDFAF